MKKLLRVSVLTLVLAAAAQERAFAWTNIRFAIGTDLAWQTGNNSLAWGILRDGQVPVHPGYFPGGSDFSRPGPQPGSGTPQTSPPALEQTGFEVNSYLPATYSVPSSDYRVPRTYFSGR